MSADDNEFQPSLLDRLSNFEPTIEVDMPRSKTQDLHEMKESLRRDIASLLNTRWICRTWPPELRMLDDTVLNYGIPDFTGVNMGDPNNQEFLSRAVRRAIEIFEPRLLSVRIKRSEGGLDRMLHLRIEGMLHAKPFPEEVAFDAELDVQSAQFELDRV